LRLLPYLHLWLELRRALLDLPRLMIRRGLLLHLLRLVGAARWAAPALPLLLLLLLLLLLRWLLPLLLWEWWPTLLLLLLLPVLLLLLLSPCCNACASRQLRAGRCWP
jgi:hypothetical protein